MRMSFKFSSTDPGGYGRSRPHDDASLIGESMARTGDSQALMTSILNNMNITP
jgi:hypothetical protein